jgi:hypothetical protein
VRNVVKLFVLEERCLFYIYMYACRVFTVPCENEIDAT